MTMYERTEFESNDAVAQAVDSGLYFIGDAIKEELPSICEAIAAGSWILLPVGSFVWGKGDECSPVQVVALRSGWTPEREERGEVMTTEGAVVTLVDGLWLQLPTSDDSYL
jgi:hypothetical protein